MAFKNIQVPDGEKITLVNGQLNVPDKPIVAFIEGDGIGVDITPASMVVWNAAVAKAYGGAREIAWMELYSGEKAASVYDGDFMPEETFDAMREYLVGIKGPLTTPVGGGFRSLNVTLRQVLDLYACVRPVRYIDGTPSPMKRPELMDTVIFRENTEDVYSGIEFRADSDGANAVIGFLAESLGITKIRERSAIGVKPVSEFGTKRLCRQALQYAIDRDRSSVTFVHKGNIMKFTEGAFRDWGYELSRDEFGATPLDGGPWHVMTNPKTGREIVIKDVIADNMMQQLLTRTGDYDVIATLNLNGDYISDAAAAQVGGLGMAPGANIGDGVALFEATHGTAPKYAGQDKVNPSSLILSGVMMLEYMGWQEAADLIVSAMTKTVLDGTVTYDLHRQMDGATKLSCSEFANAIVANM